MADVFKRTNLRFGGGFSTNQGLITDTGGGLAGVLMQNLSIQYMQNVTRLYEIGNVNGGNDADGNPVGANVYYVGGRSNGQMSAGHVLGPAVSMKEYYERFSDVCNAGENTIEMKLSASICQNSSGAKNVAYRAKYCVLTQVAMNLSAEQMLINQQSNLMFSNMEYSQS